MNIGFTEVLIILAIALLFFGPSRLPGLGKSLGEAIRGFKKGLDDAGDDKAKSEPREQLESSSESATTSTKSKERTDG